MSKRLDNPFPLFFDRRGRPLDGKVFVGAAGGDPEASPVDCYFDEDLTIAAPQPLRAIGGVLTRDGNPALIYVDANQFSMRARDADNAEVFYTINAVPDATAYQPADEDLAAIALLSTTTFGRSLLTMANAAAARTTLGIVPSLPLTGGTVTGPIARSDAGGYAYAASSDYPDGLRFFITANGAADPRTKVGDVWMELAA